MTRPTVTAADVYRLAGDVILLAACALIALGPIIARRAEEAHHQARLYGGGLA